MCDRVNHSKTGVGGLTLTILLPDQTRKSYSLLSRREGVPRSAAPRMGRFSKTARRRGWVITLEVVRRQSTISHQCGLDSVMRSNVLPQFVEPMHASNLTKK